MDRAELIHQDAGKYPTHIDIEISLLQSTSVHDCQVFDSDVVSKLEKFTKCKIIFYRINIHLPI